MVTRGQYLCDCECHVLMVSVCELCVDAQCYFFLEWEQQCMDYEAEYAKAMEAEMYAKWEAEQFVDGGEGGGHK